MNNAQLTMDNYVKKGSNILELEENEYENKKNCSLK